MWKLFAILAVLAALRFWKVDHEIISCLSVLAGVMVFWSAGVMDNIARADNNYYGGPKSRMEELWIGVNFLSTIVVIGLFIGSLFT